MDGYDIPKVDLIGKTDPYIRIKLNDQEFYEKTKVIDNSLTPVWDQSFTLYSLCKNPSLQIELKDEATGKDPLIGTADIDLDDIESGKTKEISEYLIPAKGMNKGGRIHLYIEINSYIHSIILNLLNFLILELKLKMELDYLIVLKKCLLQNL